jgi:hypothetical protein
MAIAVHTLPEPITKFGSRIILGYLKVDVTLAAKEFHSKRMLLPQTTHNRAPDTELLVELILLDQEKCLNITSLCVKEQ